MPELPELQSLSEALTAEVAGRRVTAAVASHPAVLKTVDPPLSALVGASLTGVARRGKLLIAGTDRDLSLVMHLMSAGRFGLRDAAAQRRDAVVATALVIEVKVRPLFGFLDEPTLDHAGDGAVEGSRAEVEFAIGTPQDLALERVAVALALTERQQHVKDGRREGKVRLGLVISRCHTRSDYD